MQLTINKLYKVTAKLVTLLEAELELLEEKKLQNSKTAKKDIIMMIHKLVAIIIQLNTFSKKENHEQNISLAAEDQQIITQFLQKYTKI